MSGLKFSLNAIEQNKKHPDRVLFGVLSNGERLMTFKSFKTAHVSNHNINKPYNYGEVERQILSLKGFSAAISEISAWPQYAPTPLVCLDSMSKRLNLRRLYHKDEGERFELKSFKALGGAYAISHILKDNLAKKHSLSDVSTSDLLNKKYNGVTSKITFCAATDGNHGRSVAWGANMFGSSSKIYLHSGVSDSREMEIAKYGADIVRVKGTYDDSVRQCAADSEKYSWSLVADTNAGGGDDEVPRLVMQGYTVMAQEIIDQLEDEMPTHIFVPGGVGGLAAAVASHFSESLGVRKPKIIVVEPNAASCIFNSVANSQITQADGDLDTFMACLSAGEVSPIAWPIIKAQVDDVISIPDDAAIEAMKILAKPESIDPPINAGESGVAAIAGIISCAQKPELRTKLGLKDTSVVVAIGSEGVTDSKTFERITGLKVT